MVRISLNQSETPRPQIAAMVYLAVLYLLAINVAAFAAFASDKRRAMQGDRRIPERTLLQLALLGGTPGAFAGQQILRHKTRKQPFKSQLWLIAAAQVLAVAALASADFR